MFKIYDGREEFYQWDLDRKLIVEDASVNQVHYCNRTSDCSLVCEVRDEGNLRVVDVPNILLQSNWKVRAYAYDVNYTKHEKLFNIVARTKPEDYVYTETEVLNYNTLLEKINNIENDIGQTVEDYLTENPIEVDLTGYATEEYVNKAIENIDIPETDLTGYATEKYVDDAIAAIEIPEAEAAEVDTTAYGYSSGAFLKAIVMNDLGNSTTVSSANTNDEMLKLVEEGQVIKWGMTDAGVLTLKEKATLTYFIGGKAYKKTNTTQIDLSVNDNVLKIGYNNYVKGSTNNIQKYFQGLYYDNSTSGLTAKTLPGAIDELKTMVDNAGGGSVDLSNYYTKTEVDNLITSAIGEVENGAY